MNPLEQLEDIILPEAIGWWPLAGSVWITLFIFTGLFSGLIWYFFKAKKDNAYRKQANLSLANLKQLEGAEFLIELNKLLKQVAITTYGRHICAALDGQAWLDFLRHKAAFLAQPPALVKLIARFESNIELTSQEKASLIHYTQHWIKGHHL